MLLLVFGKSAFVGGYPGRDDTCSMIEKITLPKTIREIGEKAFNRLPNVRSIMLPSSIERTGDLWFRGNVYIDRNEGELPYDALKLSGADNVLWRDSAPLNYLFLSDELGYAISGVMDFDWALKLARQQTNTVLKFDKITYRGRDLIEITIPETKASEGKKYPVSRIDFGAFGLSEGTDARYFSKITLPSSLTYIGKSCFAGQTELKEIVIPSGVHGIGAGAFYGWNRDQTIYIRKPEESITGAPWEDNSPYYFQNVQAGTGARIVWNYSE